MPHPENTYLGIDPGASGGLAALNGRTVVLASMPETERDVWDWIETIDVAMGAHSDVQTHAAVERVNGYVGDKGNPGSAMFKFGASYGGLRMALIAAGIPFEEPTPQTWQKALGVSPRRKGETKVSYKNRLKAKAQQLFPGEKVTLATADALLIAEYCRRKKEGKL